MADVLRKIKQAEQDAEKQLADAQAEVGKIAAEARRQSVQLVADATDGSVSETQATLDAARAPWLLGQNIAGIGTRFHGLSFALHDEPNRKNRSHHQSFPLSGLFVQK